GQGDQEPAGARAPLSPEPQPQDRLPVSRLCVPGLCGKVVPRLSAGGGSSRGRTRGSGPRSGGSNPPPPAKLLARPHRLEAQDTALSRLKHGFESRWGHHTNDQGFLRGLANFRHTVEQIIARSQVYRNETKIRSLRRSRRETRQHSKRRTSSYTR